jgi:hypothetical protein
VYDSDKISLSIVGNVAHDVPQFDEIKLYYRVKLKNRKFFGIILRVSMF